MASFTLLSFLNLTKYPPSLLYLLMTIGPALVFLSLAERPLNTLTEKIAVFGRVPMFYYLVHIYVLHGLAIIGAVLSGHPASDMVSLTNWVTANTQLKGYGFSLTTVYLIWIAVVIALYPLCKWYDAYKRAHRDRQWLSLICRGGGGGGGGGGKKKKKKKKKKKSPFMRDSGISDPRQG